MGKRLTLLRHAKSSWEQAGLRDFDRPLNKRGKRDAPRMGGLLYDRDFCPEIIISSDAVRARTTAELIAAEINYPVENIAYRNELYLASPHTLLATLISEAAAYNDVMLVGHNPGMTELANQLSDTRLDNLPTCGVISIITDIANWEELSEHPGTAAWCLWPKQDL